MSYAHFLQLPFPGRRIARPMKEHYEYHHRIGAAHIKFTYNAKNKHVHINALYVHKRYQRQGYANRALDKFLNFCDKHSLVVSLDAIPFDPQNPWGHPLGKPYDIASKPLKSFYRKHGFRLTYKDVPKESLCGYYMVRK